MRLSTKDERERKAVDDFFDRTRDDKEAIKRRGRECVMHIGIGAGRKGGQRRGRDVHRVSLSPSQCQNDFRIGLSFMKLKSLLNPIQNPLVIVILPSPPVV